MNKIIDQYNKISQFDLTNPQYHQETLREIGKLEQMFSKFSGDICDFEQEFLASSKYPVGMEYFVKSYLYKRASNIDIQYRKETFDMYMGDKVFENIKIAEILNDDSILDYTELRLISYIEYDPYHNLLNIIPNINPDQRNHRLVYQYLLETKNLTQVYNNLCKIPGKRAEIARHHVEFKLTPAEIMCLSDQ